MSTLASFLSHRRALASRKLGGCATSHFLSSLVSILVVVIALHSSSSLQAQTITWTGSVNGPASSVGSWNAPNNWNPVSAPGVQGSNNVNTNIASIQMGSTNSTLIKVDVAGGTPAGRSVGSIVITAGGTAANSITLGADAAGSGTFTINSGISNASVGNFTVQALTGSSVLTLDLLGSNNFDVTGTGNIVISSAITSISGTGALSKSGAGNLILSGASNYTGATTINGGTLELTTGGTLGSTTSIAVNTGGTLLISGNPGGNPATKINNAAAVTLDGGTIKIETSTSLNETMGTLTLSDTSTIDFGTLSDTLHFADSSSMVWATGEVLKVFNWNSGATEGLFFGTTSSGLTSSQLSKILLYTGGSEADFAGNASIDVNGHIVVVPEASSLLGGLGLLSLAFYRERRWFLRCRGARAQNA